MLWVKLGLALFANSSGSHERLCSTCSGLCSLMLGGVQRKRSIAV